LKWNLESPLKPQSLRNINTHDMNSVMEIGDNILFISEGELCWEGNRTQILHSDNQKLHEFVFANKQYQKIRDDKIEGK
jgi:phospholipid/cholesterol/gamma-HCH transport system ATP-binding protein